MKAMHHCHQGREMIGSAWNKLPLQEESMTSSNDVVKINVWRELADRVYQPHSDFSLEMDASHPAENLQLTSPAGNALLAHRFRLKVRALSTVPQP